MSKHYFYTGKGDELLERELTARIEEEGAGASETIKHLLLVALGMTDARENVVGRDEQAHTYGLSLRITLPLQTALSAERIKRGMSQAATLRAILHEYLNVPVPEKPKRAPRDPELSGDIIRESQGESYNDMRNLRNSPKAPVEKPLWERIRENPLDIFLVNLCRVRGCPHNDLGLHKHAGNQLAIYADAVEDGGRT